MAREIIVLDTQESGADFQFRAVAWLTAPANRTEPVPNFKSALPLSSAVSWGITPAELALLQAGTIVEQIIVVGFNTSYQPVQNAAQAKAELIQAYSDAQAALNLTSPSAKFIGASWDGTNWTAAP